MRERGDFLPSLLCGSVRRGRGKIVPTLICAHTSWDEPDTAILYLPVRWKFVMAYKITYGLFRLKAVTGHRGDILSNSLMESELFMLFDMPVLVSLLWHQTVITENSDESQYLFFFLAFSPPHYHPIERKGAR